MPSLTFTDSGTSRGGVLNSRVLIGRRLSHGVVLSDHAVSRLHAWIDPIADENATDDNGSWVITDAGSKAGTFVNDQRVLRHALHDGDRVRVGRVTLNYHDRDDLPPDVTPIELSSPNGVVRTEGILFECACGAPLWVGDDLAGKRGVCRHCRLPVTVPEPAAEPLLRETASAPQFSTPPFSPPPLSPPPPPPELPPSLAPRPVLRKNTNCSICHSAIDEGEAVHQCTDCAMVFHAQCWQENFGCSSYGCPQVNILQPANAQVKAAPAEAPAAAETCTTAAAAWEPILLAASIVASVIGVLAFGSPAAMVAVVCTAMLIQNKAQKTMLVIIAICISLIGIASGLVMSDFWWLNSRHLPAAWVRH